jgi:tellurite methyltransferase
MTDPFWEAGYQDVTGPSVFGPPSEEILGLISKLPVDARALDLGCGDGRNTLHLLEQGLRVTAVDVSAHAVAKLTAQAKQHGERLAATVQDVRLYRFAERFDLVIAHGVLHLLPRPDWESLIGRMQEHTSALGYNVVAVFTDALPPPDDLRPFMRGLFREGELLEQYHGWRVTDHRSYVLDDEHPGGVRHRHPVNKLVAQKPGTES